MAPSAIVTAPPQTANSYATLPQARTYFADHPYATDPQLDDDDALAQALLTATALIDESFDWQGASTYCDQALAWPRCGMRTISGALVPSDAIPLKIAQATAELARQLLATDRTADSDLETLDLKNIKAGPVELTFGNARSKPIPDRVVQMLARWGWLAGKQSGVRKLVRA